MVPQEETQQIRQEQWRYWEGQNERRSPYDPIISAFVQPKLDFVSSYVDLPRESFVLDVGCGNGYFTHYLDRIGQCIGLDYSNAMLRLGPDSRKVQASAFHLPFDDGTFDMVFCSNLLHHMANPLAAITEMKRTSRRYVAIHEPNRNNPAMLLLGLLKKEERLSLHFTSSYLRALARQAGMTVLACETMGFVTPNRMPRPIATLAAKFNDPNPFGAYAVLVSRCN